MRIQVKTPQSSNDIPLNHLLYSTFIPPAHFTLLYRTSSDEVSFDVTVKLYCHLKLDFSLHILLRRLWRGSIGCNLSLPAGKGRVLK